MAVQINTYTGQVQNVGVMTKQYAGAPTSADYQYPLGFQWVDISGGALYFLASVSGTSATWEKVIGGSTGVTSLNGDSGSATPTAGAITLAGTSAQGLSSSATGSTVTFTIADATTSQKGVLETATNAEGVAVTATDKALVPGNMTTLFASPPAIGGTAAAAGTFTQVTSPLWVTNTNTGSTQSHISITPNTAIGASQIWKAFYVDGAALDPSGASSEQFGVDIDFTGVSLTNDPEIIGVRSRMPATHSGEAEKAAGYFTGWGYVTELCSGDHDAALRTLGGNLFDYDGTSTAAGQTFAQLLSVVQTAGSTGGEIHVLDVEKAGGGSAEVVGLSTGNDVAPIHQHVGAFGAVDYGWVVTSGPTYTDRTTEFGSGASDVQIFVADNDEIMVGSSASFSEIQVILNTVASQTVLPTFYYSIAGPSWTQFTPTDGTAGFTQNGNIEFTAGDLSGWAATTVNGQNYYWIRIVRTRNNIVTPPTEDTIKVAAPTLYEWDENGELIVKKVTTNEFVFDGISSGYTSSEWNFKQVGVQTADATVTDLVTISLAEGEMVSISAFINGFQNDYTDAVGGRVFCTFRRGTGGNVTVVNGSTIDISESDADTDVAVTADVGNQEATITVQGPAAETWNWVACYHYHKTLTNA